MKSILTVIFSFLFIVSGFSQTRNVVVGTNDVIVQPTNFWSANASNGRTGLGLGSAATNPASVFQPSSATLSNLASSNGASLTNIAVSNVVGALATNGSAAALTNFPSSLLTTNGSAANLTNFPANFLTTNGNAANLTNFPSSLLRTNGSASGLTNFPSSVLLTNGNGFGLTNLNASNITGVIPSSNIPTVSLTNIGGTLAIASGGTGATNAGGARTNLGLGATWLTNNDVTNFRTAIGLGTNNAPTFSGMYIFNGTNPVFYAVSSVPVFEVYVPIWFGDSGTNNIFQFEAGAADQAKARTNLGLGATWLTNTNNPVFVNTNGEVVSPTNFWQVAPIQTVVQNLAPITNSTNAATNARNLYVYSLATNITGVTNTVTLPTNTSTFAGDSATIIHQGTTSSVTAVRQAGAGSNLITINRFDESIKFIYENNSWTTYHNISFQEPIYFSGTNASANAAVSRTNFGLGATWLTNTNVTNFRTAIGLGATNDVIFADITLTESGEDDVSVENSSGSILLRQTTNALVEFGTGAFHLFYNAIGFNNITNAAATRTNLGLGASNNVVFGQGEEANVGIGVGSTNVGLASGGATIQGRLGLIEGGNIVAVLDGDASPFFGLYRPITFQGTNATSNAATTRTNLFGHGGLSTNIDIKLNNNDGMRLYFTNGILTNAVTPIP